MAKNALIVCNYRLRNRDEFNKIVTNFKSRKYDIVDMGDIEKENFDIKILEETIGNISKSYDNISVISNIRDVLFIWYRMYNALADNFIFFIDKINYNILKKQENSDIFTAIAEFKGAEQEKLYGKIYLNINYTNYESIFGFLLKEFKFKYFENLTNIDYFTAKRKKNELKSITDYAEYINNGSDYENKNFEEYIKEADFFYPYYLLFIIKNYTFIQARESIIKLLKRYELEEEKNKNNLADLTIKTEGFDGLSFIEKIGLLSINVGIGVKDHNLTTTPIINEIIRDNGENAQYYYHIFINLVLGGEYISGVEYRKRFKEAIKLSDKYYRDKTNVISEYNKNSKKLLFVVDSLQTGNYSGSKFIFELVKNIKKINKEYEIVIYCEDNFFGRQEENIFIYDFNNGAMVSSTNDKKEHNEFSKAENIKIVYSHINKTKEERINDILEFANNFQPEAVITTTIFSNSINLLFEYFPVIAISLGGINSFNKYDMYLLPHIEYLINMMKEYGVEYNKEKMVSFDYGGNFETSNEKAEIKEFKMEQNDFLMITVGVKLKVDLTQEYIELVCNFLKSNSNVKWIIIGETEIPLIDIKYSDLIGKQIFKIKFYEKLGTLYRVCDLYLNPPRIGGGFSMAEAVVNDLCVLTTSASPAGALHCGRENGVANFEEYKRELEKLYRDKNYRDEKLKKEQSVQESLSYKNLIPKLMEHIETAKKFYFERKGMNNEQTVT